MKSEDIILIHEDGCQVCVTPYFTDCPQIKATVLILHGLAEHKNRYREFTLFLNHHGYDVYLYNHRGHGTEKKLDELGYFGDSRGWETVIHDAVDVLSYISEHNRSSKLFLFGHSMGSLIARGATQYCNLVDAAVFAGTTAPSPLAYFAGRAITGFVCALKGKRYVSPFLKRMLFGRRHYRALFERTSNDWLTRNQASVGLYMNDPYCGFDCTAGLYHDLIKLSSVVSNPAALKKTPEKLPILLISGAMDPVSHYGDEVIHLFEAYKKIGHTNIECTLYEDCRHELLNEINRHEIMEDILAFFNNQ